MLTALKALSMLSMVSAPNALSVQSALSAPSALSAQSALSVPSAPSAPTGLGAPSVLSALRSLSALSAVAQQLVPTEQRALRVRTELAEHAQHLASNAWCCAHICVRLGWVALGISAMIEIPKAPSEFFKSRPPAIHSSKRRACCACCAC